MKKFDFYFGIASYNRKDRQPMLRLLNSLGYPKEQILLAVQCEQDFKEYEPIYGDMATIIYQEGKNISDNKNAILDYMVEYLGNQRVVILSDKVRAINWIDRSRKTHTVETKTQMDKLVRTAFELTRQIGGRVWGCYNYHQYADVGLLYGDCRPFGTEIRPTAAIKGRLRVHTASYKQGQPDSPVQ